MKVYQEFCIGIIILSMLGSCNGERYRTDRKNKLTKKAKIASDYLANQAVEITQQNIDTRQTNEKSARRALNKQQSELNEANAKTSKVKKQKKHAGNFKFY